MAFTFRQKVSLVVGIILLVAMPFAFFLAQTTQLLAPRAKQDAQGSTLFITPQSGTTDIALDQTFTIDVILSTSNDPDFVVTQAAAAIKYSQSVEAISIQNGTIFPSLTTSSIDSGNHIITLSGQLDSNGDPNPTGFSGESPFASITFKAVKPGNANLSFTFIDEGSSVDTTIVGFEKGKLKTEQTPHKRLLVKPNPTIFKVNPGGNSSDNNTPTTNPQTPTPISLASPQPTGGGGTPPPPSQESTPTSLPVGGTNPTPLPTTTPTSPPTSIPAPTAVSESEYNIADLNLDGIVDILDYSIMVSQFLQTGDKSADLNSDNIVDILDYSILVRNFLRTDP